MHEVQCRVQLVELGRVLLGSCDFAEYLRIPCLPSLLANMVERGSFGDFRLDIGACLVC